MRCHLLLLLAACADPLGAGPSLSGGTELGLRVLTHEGGARVPIGLYDRDLGVGCTFRDHEDTSQRCLPDAPRAVPTLWFDTGCNQEPAALTPEHCVTADLVLERVAFDEATCDRGVTWQVYEARSGADRFYERKATTCEETRLPESSGLIGWRTGDRAQVGAFVTGQVQTTQVRASVAVRHWVGQDGSAWPIALRVGSRDCTATRFADGETRCVPLEGRTESSPGRWLFADDSCSTLAAPAPEVCDAGDPLLLERSATGDVQTIWTTRPIPNVWTTQNGRCVPADPGGDWVAADEALDTEVFPALTMRSELGDEVASRFVTDDRGQVVIGEDPPLHLVRRSGAACVLRMDRDGTPWCVDMAVPMVDRGALAYRDEACAKPVFASFGRPPERVLERAETEGACPDAPSEDVVWRVWIPDQAPPTDLRRYAWDGVSCVEVGDFEATDGRTWTELRSGTLGPIGVPLTELAPR